jgi:hypothetical protein
VESAVFVREQSSYARVALAAIIASDEIDCGSSLCCAAV